MSTNLNPFMAEETFLTVYKKKLKESSTRETKFVVTAVAPYEEYAERVGFIRGIEEALAIFEETQKHFFPTYRKD